MKVLDSDLDRLSAVEIAQVIRTTVANELEACAQLADDLAQRLIRSGKTDESMVAITLSAQIRARKPQ